MGATDVCPGTYLCSTGTSDATATCQVSGKSDRWKSGDAIIMNQQSYHRGAAHVDPNGPHRSLFIITFAPRPDWSAETRLLGQGGTYSLRWDMWGHTLDDFEHATTKVTQPWAALRGLGLYKPKDAEWGWDWVTVSSMIIANSESINDNAIGGLALLPKFLSVDYRDMGWRDYCKANVKLWEDVMFKANVVGNGLFIAASLLIGIALFIAGKRNGSSKTPMKNAIQSILRVVLLDVALVVVAICLLKCTEKSQWAKAIKARTLYSSPFNVPEVNELESDPHLAVVSNTDVLITDRFDDKRLGSLVDSMDYQGGNIKFKSTIKGASLMVNHLATADISRLVDSILDGAKREGSRMVSQNEFADWVVLSDSDSTVYTTQALLLEANPLMAALHKESRFLLSLYKHGFKYKGAMARKHSLLNINSVMKKMMENERIPVFSLHSQWDLLGRKAKSKAKSKMKKRKLSVPRRFAAMPSSTRSEYPDLGKRIVLSLPINITLADKDALQLGDIVEVHYRGVHNEVSIQDILLYIRFFSVLTLTLSMWLMCSITWPRLLTLSRDPLLRSSMPTEK